MRVYVLHTDEEYNRRELEDSEEDNSMKGLKWDGASLRKVTLHRPLISDSFQFTQMYITTVLFVGGPIELLKYALRNDMWLPVPIVIW